MIKQNIIKPIILGSSLMLLSTAGLAENSNADYFDAETAEKNRTKYEARGLIGGAIIGGLLAGPPGAILSAAFGALMSNSFTSDKENKQLEASLDNSQLELFALQEKHQRLEHQHQLALEEKQNLEFISARENNSPANCCSDTEIALHFESNSSNVEDHYQAQLQEIARLSQTIPDSVIEITGYSDRRGGNRDNLLLSQRRIKSVENSLQHLGVNNTIQSNAFGESRPLKPQQSLEGNFFDRRVIVRIRSANNDFISQNK